MQVQSVSNNRQAVKFSADPNTEKAKAFVNMNDSQLRTLAYITSYDKDTDKRNKKSMTSTLYALPIAASLSSGILTKGKLGTKAAAAVKTGGSWGFALVVLGVFNAAKNAVVSKSEKLQKFEQQHPVVSLLTDIGLFMGALSIGTKGARKAGGKILEKTPNLTAKVMTKIYSAKAWLNKTMLNKKVLPKISKNIEKLDKKAPLVVAAGKSVIANSVLILFLAGLVRGNANAKKNRDTVENNFNTLKAAQMETAKRLASLN